MRMYFPTYECPPDYKERTLTALSYREGGRGERGRGRGDEPLLLRPRYPAVEMLVKRWIGDHCFDLVK